MNADKVPKAGPPFWRRWLAKRFAPELKERRQIVELLKQARKKGLIGSDAQSMMEGVLQVSELRVRDIMIPRAQMVVIRRDSTLEEILPTVVESAHSRFPVIADDPGEVVGLLLAKDLLAYCDGNDKTRRFDIRDVLRAAVFVPGSKRLNVMLKEFRSSRNHMAIVVDEYGTAAGLVTIEDVLEQIVGEIADEHDFDEGAVILKHTDREYMVKAHTEIEDFNDYFGSDFGDGDFDTVGGLVTHALGHLPKRGETVDVDGFRFEILRADSRRIHLLKVILLESGPPKAETAAD